jgi:hypothetical protein
MGRGADSRYGVIDAVIAALGTSVVLAALTIIGFTQPAQALPSFARQTGQPCGTCHTDFPGLTPFGRRFKLLGYTVGGGQYRTTPFPAGDPKNPDENLRNYAKGANPTSAESQDKGWVPPISMMAITGFTQTQAPLPPPTDPYKPNGNLVLSPVSVFWGGALTENIGAFAQVTYNAPPVGGFPDPFGHTWTWDNTDVRFAKSTKIFDLDVIFGITANNNPTVQDVWNTTPAWTFPYAVSNVAPTPAAKTIIDGTFAAHVGSIGSYLFVNDMLYVEGSLYRTLDFRTQNTLGTDPFGAPGLFNGAAPYWRVALEPHWGNHWLMVGTFGMIADVHPWIDPTFALGTTATFPQTDKFTDVGFDSQYQYQGQNFWITLRGSWIHEYQKLDASFGNGLSANPTNELNTLRLQASLAYGGDNRVVFTGQYFSTWGTSDALLYGGLASALSPNSKGWIAEIAYIPFGTSNAPGWPWANARIGLQYTWYDMFEGTSIGARDHNALFLHAWIAM